MTFDAKIFARCFGLRSKEAQHYSSSPTHSSHGVYFRDYNKGI
jgi:hypothetical protein